MTKSKNTELYISLSLLCIPILVVFGIYFYSTTQDNSGLKKVTLMTQSEEVSSQKIDSIYDPFLNIQITAKSAIVKDINSGEILYQKSPNIPLPLASLNKIMTSLVAYLEADPNQQVVIDHWALMKDGEDFFTVGESFSLKELMDFVLVKSSNDGAAAIASAINQKNQNNSFVQEMNQIANQIGMYNTFFLNETGLDQNLTTAGSFGTSNDIATLMEFILKNYPEIMEHTKEMSFEIKSKNGILHKAENTNNIIPELQNLVASKTGFTDLAGGDHIVYIRDAEGCESQWNITFPASVRINPEVQVENACENNTQTNLVTV
jgi:D-alanyl-D-alanine carboxypeptidase (penicillin-binding protein 5/6)